MAKSVLKYVPVLGWSWYFSGYVFLKRVWEKDRKVLVDNLKNLVYNPKGYHYCVIQLLDDKLPHFDRSSTWLFDIFSLYNSIYIKTSKNSKRITNFE